ncbi:MAG TPA: RNA polymerase sigma factor [Acidobacteriota bacterium]|nr:RNA polymerase sigma factor [Acidobacteriota bacterium]
MSRSERDLKAKQWLRKIAQEGDHEAGGMLYKTFSHPIIKFLYGMLGIYEDAEGVFHDVMIAVWTGAAKRYRGGNPTSYLFGIAHKQALARISRRTPSVDPGRLFECEDHNPLIDELLIKHDLTMRMLRGLPQPDRELLILSEVHELSSIEIGKILNRPDGTVRRRRREILERLRSSRLGK